MAYLREMDRDELRGKFPGMPEIAPGLRLWAVFAADGRPILLTDERETRDRRRDAERSRPGQHSLSSLRVHRAFCAARLSLPGGEFCNG